MNKLNEAIELATKAHEGQVDKAGQPYIQHPLHVMAALSGESETVQIVAVLHDVVEDTDVTLEDIQELFGQEVHDGVQIVTKEPGMDYDEYIIGIKNHETTRKVKIADLEHNMDLRRIDVLTEKDIVRVRKYHRVWRELKKIGKI